MFAAQNIAPGTELAYNYSWTIGSCGLVCHCGVPTCVGTLLNEAHEDLKLDLAPVLVKDAELKL